MVVLTVALDVRVALGAGWAAARGLVVACITLRCVCASVCLTHWAAHTVEPVTRLVVGAVLVVVTLHTDTGE